MFVCSLFAQCSRTSSETRFQKFYFVNADFTALISATVIAFPMEVQDNSRIKNKIRMHFCGFCAIRFAISKSNIPQRKIFFCLCFQTPSFKYYRYRPFL